MLNHSGAAPAEALEDCHFTFALCSQRKSTSNTNERRPAAKTFKGPKEKPKKTVLSRLSHSNSLASLELLGSSAGKKM